MSANRREEVESTKISSAVKSPVPLHVNHNDMDEQAFFRRFSGRGRDTKRSQRDEMITQSHDEFEKACAMIGCYPLTCVRNQLKNDIIDLSGHKLGPKIAKALAITLLNNKYVTCVNLRDTFIGLEGTLYIGEMIARNSSIHELILSENNIGRSGLQSLIEALEGNVNITKLDISGNGLGDQEAQLIGNLIQQRNGLIELYVHHNRIAEKGGIPIGNALETNETIDVLDISWNHLRGQGAIAIAKSLQSNVCLKRLDVSWNGFSKEGAKILGEALSVNKRLEELDLTNNRISGDGMVALMMGLKKNGCLKTLRVGKNPFNYEVASYILKLIQSSDTSALRIIDLTDICVSEDFTSLLDRMMETRYLAVNHGPLVNRKSKQVTVKAVDPSKRYFRSPMDRMFIFMYESGYRVIELLKKLDKDKSMSVDREEFKEGLNSVNVPLTDDEINDVIEKLDTDGDGEVDFRELAAGEKAFISRMRRFISLKSQEEVQAVAGRFLRHLDGI